MACRFWKDRPDGFHGYCQHPEAQTGDPCILNTEDTCLLREEYPKCSECGRRVDISDMSENVRFFICEVCAAYITAAPGAGIVPREEEGIHTCAVCGHTMSSEEYAEKGCIFCGADSEEEQ